MKILESWFKSPNTWDDLKTSNRQMIEAMRGYEHKIKSLEQDIDLAKRNVEAEVELALKKKEVEHQVEISKLKSKYEKEFYDKLNEALLKGTPQTEFAQNLLIKMVEKAPVALPKIGG